MNYTKETTISGADVLINNTSTIQNIYSKIQEKYPQQGDDIIKIISAEFAPLTRHDYISNMNREELALHAGKIIGNILHNHPSDENLIKISESFLTHLAEAAGHKLDFGMITPERWDEVYTRLRSDNSSSALNDMSRLFNDALDPDRWKLLNAASLHLRWQGINPDTVSIRTGNVGDKITGWVLEADTNFASIVVPLDGNKEIIAVQRSNLPEELPGGKRLVTFKVQETQNAITQKQSDDYHLQNQIPNASQVFPNKLGIDDDQERLSAALYRARGLREREIANGSAPRFEISVDGLKELHHYLHQDIYDWAGKEDPSKFGAEDEALANCLRPLERLRIGTSGEAQDEANGIKEEELIESAEEFLTSLIKEKPFVAETSFSTGLTFLTLLGKSAGTDINFNFISEVRKEQVISAVRNAEPTQALHSLLKDAISPTRQEILDNSKQLLWEHRINPSLYSVRTALPNEIITGTIVAYDAYISLVELTQSNDKQLVIIDTNDIDHNVVDDIYNSKIITAQSSNSFDQDTYVPDVEFDKYTANENFDRFIWAQRDYMLAAGVSLLETYDAQLLKEIHSYLFKGVYLETERPFPESEIISGKLTWALNPISLSKGNSYTLESFCETAGEAMTRLHSIQPFLGGNREVIEVFIALLGKEYGFNVNFDVITDDRHQTALRAINQSRYNSSFKHILADACTPGRNFVLKEAQEMEAVLIDGCVVRSARKGESIIATVVQANSQIACVKLTTSGLDQIIVVDRQDLPKRLPTEGKPVFFTAKSDYFRFEKLALLANNKNSAVQENTHRPLYAESQKIPTGSYYYKNKEGDTAPALQNKLGLEKFDTLIIHAHLEAQKESSNIKLAPLSRDTQFDTTFLKNIHNKLYGNIFEWAGHTRNESVIVNGKRIAPDVLPNGTDIEGDLKAVLGSLGDINALRDLSLDEFASRLGDVFARVNYIQPFRYGSLDTMKVYCSELAAACNYELKFEYITQKRLEDALSAAPLDIVGTKMEQLFIDAIDPRRQAALHSGIEYLKRTPLLLFSECAIEVPNSGDAINGTILGFDDQFAFVQIKGVEKKLAVVDITEVRDFIRQSEFIQYSKIDVEFHIREDISRASISLFYPDQEINGELNDDSFGVLRNKLGLYSNSGLSKEIEKHIELKFAEVKNIDIPINTFDANYLKEIHSHLYGDIYDWAGYTRNESVEIGGSRLEPLRFMKHNGVDYALSDEITKELDRVLQPLSDIEALRTLSQEEFAACLGKAFAECNRIQPFADGTTQTLMMFSTQLAAACGHNMNFTVSAQDITDVLGEAAREMSQFPRGIDNALDRASMLEHVWMETNILESIRPQEAAHVLPTAIASDYEMGIEALGFFDNGALSPVPARGASTEALSDRSSSGYASGDETKERASPYYDLPSTEPISLASLITQRSQSLPNVNQMESDETLQTFISQSQLSQSIDQER